MRKREIALSLMRAAGYHQDNRKRAELLVTARVNRKDLNDAWEQGIRAKQNEPVWGVRCTCPDCRAN